MFGSFFLPGEGATERIFLLGFALAILGSYIDLPEEYRAKKLDFIDFEFVGTPARVYIVFFFITTLIILVIPSLAVAFLGL